MAKFVKVESVEQIKKLENSKDIIKSLDIICEFWDVYSCAIVKNGIPVGVALAPSSYEAKIKAIDCNPVEAIGGVVAFSEVIDEHTAKSLSRMKFPVIILTQLPDDAVKYFEKSDSTVIELGFDLKDYKTLSEEQESNLTPDNFKVATKLKPTQEQVEDMVFAWKILKTIKKEAVVIAKDFKTRAIELGSNVKTIEKAMDNACDGSKEAILAISSNICDEKQLHPAIQGRILGIIEPKSMAGEDKQILKTAEKYGITVIVTGKTDEE